MTKEAKLISNVKVVDKKGEAQQEGLEMMQKHFKEAAKKVAQTRKCDRQKSCKVNTGRDHCNRRSSGEESRLIERKVPRRQARRPRAEHAVKWSLMPGKKYRKTLYGTVRERWRHGRRRWMGKRTTETLCRRDFL